MTSSSPLTAADAAEALIERCFALGPAVRYVAVYRHGRLVSRERAALAGASSSESDRYEELLVNPTVITLLRQRGEIDCGGLRYVLIRYGNFHQFVHPVPGGHLSVALEPSAEPDRLVPALVELAQAAAEGG
ncbi:MAG TPA: hypothetical protein VNK43_12170 [Gemmatimonadales bacterium]|nr:hypothetical protein [Gemmatimonadales bacterium]